MHRLLSVVAAGVLVAACAKTEPAPEPVRSVRTLVVAADTAGPALASMLIYILMALVLALRPAGLFPARG